MLHDLLDNIDDFATTGIFTDYCDANSIEYIYVDGLKLNIQDSIFYGPCKTVKCESGPFSDENITLGLGYLDHCEPGDVLIVQGSDNYAYFGELMSRLSQARGIKGAIIFGATRDTRFTKNYLPVAAKSYKAVDIKSRGRVAEVGGTLNLGISEEMYVVADNDGAIFFDKKNASEIMSAVVKMIEHEKNIVSYIDNGSSVEDILKITDAF